jgi:hypothetical protein
MPIAQVSPAGNDLTETDKRGHSMGFNWSGSKSRELMRRHGTQDAREEDVIVRPLRKLRKLVRARRLSKDEQRAQGAVALEQWQAKKGITTPLTQWSDKVRALFNHRLLACTG